jgi:hypothetical protein
MFETTSVAKKTAPERQGQVRHLEVHNITFEGGDPCRPRYGSLYKAHFPREFPSEDVQLEPAFQVGDDVDAFSVTLHLHKDAPVDFVKDPARLGHPLCRVLNEPCGKPDIDYKCGDSRACTVTWKRLSGGAVTRIFRIYCRPKEGDFTDEQKVYGGIFLAFTTAPVGSMGKRIKPKPSGNNDRREVFLIGTDEQHRPIYDVHSKKLPCGEWGIEIEPAFRVRRGRLLEFSMTMGIPYAGWKDGLTFLQPPAQPEWLTRSWRPEKYGFGWQTPTQPCVDHHKECYQARITSFHLHPILPDAFLCSSLPQDLVDQEWKSWQEYKQAVEQIGVDPTIIEPPSCDPVYKVCDP